MSYYEPGMPPDLHHANIFYDELAKRIRNNPSTIMSYLGLALMYAQKYFKAQTSASKKALDLILHLDRCDVCRGTGWESCDDMKAHLSEGKSFTTTVL